jgi:hypothetical protein
MGYWQLEKLDSERLLPMDAYYQQLADDREERLREEYPNR